ncbi:hypothetical protein QBC47DRAFT_404660 [Echria macrotheca]|uniref:Fungal N-terminal domain-containing protein n=1 Tax=Echria macrotheca TaxID=438768 RepID=A0AAJ0B7W0_9PEZI|nr:hypothetical protein QBC47DRAFT_404660 [Echria macrotheca]
MDPLSVAAASVGFADAVGRLAEGCIRLYRFWESLQDAPAAVQAIKDELILLTTLLQPMASEPNLIPPVILLLNACYGKVQELWGIVAELDVEALRNAQKREHLFTKYKMTTKVKQVEKFRQGLSELKSSLTLALTYQNTIQPRVCVVTNETVETVQIQVSMGANAKGNETDTPEPQLTKVSREFESTTETKSTQYPNAFSSDMPDTSGELQVPKDADASIIAIASNRAVQGFLQKALHLAVDDLVASGTMEQLMMSTMRQVSSFDTKYAGGYDTDSFDMHKVPSSSSTPRPTGANKPETPRLARSKTCHQKTSMGVMFGSIWIRTSTLKAAEGSNASKGDLEVITSFIFYPACWLSKVGLRYGTEANLQWSATTGWRFNVTAIRAVPEDALIFDMCRDGDIKGVSKLLTRGDASLKDTSPKGWTPLHFAAESGHVELCSFLIRKGADRQALAYEGPTEEALTPLGIWSEFCGTTPSKRKIEMINAFGAECLDVSELGGDGWVVGHNLIKHMSLENCSMAETAVQWVYTQKQSEILVALGANSIWHGLQQAVRGFLVEEHGKSVISGLLQQTTTSVDGGGRGRTTAMMDGDRWQSQVSAIGHWLALRASGRELLPLIVQACQCLQVDGFDPIPGMEGFGIRELNRSLPLIYTTWAKTSPRILSNVTALVEAELEHLLSDLSLDRDGLVQCIQASRDELVESDEGDEWHDAVAHHWRCGDCEDDYTTLGKGLVQPRRISFDECRATRHRHYCECLEFLGEKGVKPPENSVPESGEVEEEADEEFRKDVEVDVGLIDSLCETYSSIDTDEPVLGDPFYDAAKMLYRAQGRRWIGTYRPSEALCGACFLKRELYAGPGGPGDGSASFTPVPTTYVSACPPEFLGATYTTG